MKRAQSGKISASPELCGYVEGAERRATSLLEKEAYTLTSLIPLASTCWRRTSPARSGSQCTSGSSGKSLEGRSTRWKPFPSKGCQALPLNSGRCVRVWGAEDVQTKHSCPGSGDLGSRHGWAVEGKQICPQAGGTGMVPQELRHGAELQCVLVKVREWLVGKSTQYFGKNNSVNLSTRLTSDSCEGAWMMQVSSLRVEGIGVGFVGFSDLEGRSFSPGGAPRGRGVSTWVTSRPCFCHYHHHLLVI